MMARLERVAEGSSRARSEKRDERTRGNELKNLGPREEERWEGKGGGRGERREIKAMNDAAAGASWRV